MCTSGAKVCTNKQSWKLYESNSFRWALRCVHLTKNIGQYIGIIAGTIRKTTWSISVSPFSRFPQFFSETISLWSTRGVNKKYLVLSCASLNSCGDVAGHFFSWKYYPENVHYALTWYRILSSSFLKWCMNGRVCFHIHVHFYCIHEYFSPLYRLPSPFLFSKSNNNNWDSGQRWHKITSPVSLP